MSSLKQSVQLFLIILLSATTVGSATAAPPSQAATDAYVNAYTKMGKAAALMFNHDNIRANARNAAITVLADAQSKIIKARAAWITAVANAKATNAKTLQTLQEVRSKALDNNLKVAKTFYDKRALYDAYKESHSRKRPTQEDLIRYSKASVPERPANFQIGGNICWPEVLLQDEFSDYRTLLDCLFSERKTSHNLLGSGVCCQVRNAVGKMREELRSKIREMNPAEYVAARKFLESVAYESRFPMLNQSWAAN